MFLRTILIIEDDNDLREMLIEQLSFDSEFKIFQLQTTMDSIEFIKENLIDLILMSTNLPDMNCYEALEIFREKGITCPILLMGTPFDSIVSKKKQPILIKPFRLSTLLNQIRVSLEAYEKSKDSSLWIGSCLLHPYEKTFVTQEGEHIKLTEKEVLIIRYLYHRKKTVSRQKLLEIVWGYNQNVTTHTLETHIYTLRQKIEKKPEKSEIIITESGGYRLIC